MYRTTKLSTIELDKLFLPTNKLITVKTLPISFGEVFIDLLIKEIPKDVASIALDSMIFRQCLKEKIFNFLQENSKRTNEENLCFALYSFDSNNLIESANFLFCLTEKCSLAKILFENYKILFEYSVNDEITGFSDFCQFLIKTFEKIFIQVILNLLINSSIISLSLVIKHLSCYFTSTSEKFTMNLFQKLLESYFREFFQLNEEMKIDDKIGMKILMRTYLGEWKDYGIISIDRFEQREFNKAIKNSKDLYSQNDYLEEIQNLYGSDIIHLDKRYRYLNLMKPFSKNSIDESINEQNHKINLIKIQSLLSSSIVPIEILDEIILFTKHNNNLSGTESILSLIHPISMTIDCLIERSPQTILGFAIDRFVNDDDWTQLNDKLNKKITQLEDKLSLEYICYINFFRGKFFFFNVLTFWTNKFEQSIQVETLNELELRPELKWVEFGMVTLLN